jgi:hypothetical protein
LLERVQDAKTWIAFYLTRWLRPQQGVLLDGLVRGLGRTTFTLTEAEGNRDACLQELMAKVDEVIRLAPNPVGIGDFLIRVRVFKRPPNPDSYGSRSDWRRLLIREFWLDSEEQNCLIDRYRDWEHGDARQRLTSLLGEYYPTSDPLLVEVAVTSISQLLVELVKEQRINFRVY